MDFERPPGDPIALLRDWVAEAEAETELPNANAMTLATVDPSGRPSLRVVLLKGLDDAGLVFFTNHNSRKGRDMAANPRVALVFHWDPLHRQVVIEGSVAMASDEESDAYFASRPRASQLGAWASRQSDPVDSRDVLDAAYAEVEKRFEGGEVPRPEFWGGYRVTIESITFWQARVFRLHDRVQYSRDGDGWRTARLYP